MSGKNSSERFFFLFSPFLGLSQRILARQEAIIVFSNFLNFFTFFLEFSITFVLELVGTIFFFYLSWPFPTYFGMKRSDIGFFLIFEFFCYFFGNFSYRLRTNSSERFFLFSLFLGLSQLILAGKVAKMVVFTFFNFFCCFLEFSITSWVGTHRNDFFFVFIFFFSLSRPFPTYFGLERSNNGVF